MIERAAGDAAFCGVWLDAAPGLLEQRVRARIGGPSDADASVLERQLAGDKGELSWLRLDAALPPDRVVELILDAAAGSSAIPGDGHPAPALP